MRPVRALALTTILFAAAAAAAPAGSDVILRESFEAIDCVAEPASPACPVVIAATPKFELSPGESDVYCYYFRSANELPVDFARTFAEVRGVVVDAELYGTHTVLGVPVERMPPSSVSTVGCGLLVALDGTVATLLATLDLDGPLALVDDALGRTPRTISPSQPMFLKITATNAGDRVAGGSVRWLAPRTP